MNTISKNTAAKKILFTAIFSQHKNYYSALALVAAACLHLPAHATSYTLQSFTTTYTNGFITFDFGGAVVDLDATPTDLKNNITGITWSLGYVTNTNPYWNADVAYFDGVNEQSLLLPNASGQNFNYTGSYYEDVPMDFNFYSSAYTTHWVYQQVDTFRATNWVWDFSKNEVSVPEPGSFALLMVGLGAAGFSISRPLSRRRIQ